MTTVLTVNKNRIIKKILFIRLASEYFIKSAHLRNIRPPIDLAYSMAMIDGLECEKKLIDCWIEKLKADELIEKTIGFSPDMVVVSCTTDAKDVCLEYSQKLKLYIDPLIVAVGQHVSSKVTDLVYKNSPIDLGIIGEPETSIKELISKINAQESLEEIKEIFQYKANNNTANIVTDLEQLPNINHNIFSDEKGYKSFYPLRMSSKVKWGYITTSRGCPYECIFCSQTMRDSYGKKPRLRAPKAVVKEIKALIKKGVNVITFCDDNFTTVKEHVISICNEIIRERIKIKWVIHARVDNLDGDLMKLMKEAGCILLRIGVESGSKRVVKILKKTAYPDTWIEDVKRIFYQANKIGLATNALFIIGSPTETKKEIQQTIDFACTLKTDMILVNYFTPYPGSSYYKEFQSKNILKGNSLYHYHVSDQNVSNLSSGELKNMLGVFYQRFYLRPIFLLKHVFNYGFFYLRNIYVLKTLIKSFLKVRY